MQQQQQQQQPYGQVAPWGYQPPPQPKSLKHQLLEKLLNVGGNPEVQGAGQDMSDLKQQLIDKFLGSQQPQPPPFGKRGGKGGPRGGGKRGGGGGGGGNDGGGLMDVLRNHFLGGSGGGSRGGGWGKGGGMRGEL